jgi:hypothetical protein
MLLYECYLQPEGVARLFKCSYDSVETSFGPPPQQAWTQGRMTCDMMYRESSEWQTAAFRHRSKLDLMGSQRAKRTEQAEERFQHRGPVRPIGWWSDAFTRDGFLLQSVESKIC